MAFRPRGLIRDRIKPATVLVTTPRAADVIVTIDPSQGAHPISPLIYGLNGATPESFLSAVTRRQMLQRMLRNLHLAFRERRDMERWRAIVELSLVLEPWNATLVGERGMLHYRLGRLEQALDDLETYVTAGDRPVTSPGAIRLLDHLRLRRGGSEYP